VLQLNFKLRVSDIVNFSWIFLGQVISVIAAVLGLRIISDKISPDLFGSATLYIGIIALLQGAVALPIMQSALWCFPTAITDGTIAELKRVVYQSVRKDAVCVLLMMFTIILVAGKRIDVSGLIVFASVSLFIGDIVRSYEVTFLNAEGRNALVSLILVCDAVMKPLFAVALLYSPMSSKVAAVVLGYSIGSWAALLVFWILVNKVPNFLNINGSTQVDNDKYVSSLRRYAKPLRINPVLGWISGQGDRYIIGAFGDLRGVGIYSSIYGLVSRPFLILSSIVEMLFRQQFYSKVKDNDLLGARKILHTWLFGVVLSSVVVFCILLLVNKWIASLVLGSRFQGYDKIMVWIESGYVFHVVYLVFERVFYAADDTKSVLRMQIFSAALSVIIPLLMVYKFGWVGAAWSVPIYFGIQMLVGFIVLKMRYSWIS